MRAVLLAEAEKVSVNSAAVEILGIINDGADAFGSQAIVVGMDVLCCSSKRRNPQATRSSTAVAAARMGLDAVPGARRCRELGAGGEASAINSGIDAGRHQGPGCTNSS